MKEKKIVKREHVSKGYTLDLEEMTLNQAKKKKKKLSCKMESLKKSIRSKQSWRKKKI